MTSPICLVNTNPTLNGVNVTGGSTVTIKLNSSAGVTTWSISCINTDDLHAAATVNASLVVNPITFTATFTAPASTTASALIFQSIVNSGKDINGNPQPLYTTTFGVFVLTATSLRVGAFGEITEGDSTFGWISKVNNLIRNFTGSAASAGAGLFFLSGAYNVGQNADNTIKVNADDIQLNPAFYSQFATPSTLVQRTSGNAITVGQLNATSVNNSGNDTVGGTLTVTGLTTLNGGLTLGTSTSSINWVSNVSGPQLTQLNVTTNSATGQNLTIAAQTATGSTSTGGSLNLVAGTGTSVNGNVNLYAGSSVLVATFNGSGIAMNKANIQFGSTQASNPTISQLTASSNVATNSINITAQAPFATATGSNRTPGFINLNLAAPTNGGTSRAAVVVTDNSNTVASFGGDASGNSAWTIAGAATLTVGTSLLITNTVSCPSFLFSSAQTGINRFSAITPQADPANWKAGTTGFWTNLSLGTKVICNIDPPQGCTITQITVGYQGAGAHAGLPATMPLIDLRVYNRSSNLDISQGTQSDTSGTTGAFQTLHDIVLSGLNVSVDKRNNRYHVDITAESGANALVGATMVTVQYTFTRPAASAVGLD